TPEVVRPTHAPLPPASPAPTSAVHAGAAPDFEPRLIRPDAASHSSRTAPQAQTESVSEAARAAGAADAASAGPRPVMASPAAAPAPSKVRTAPPDPIEAFRPDAGATAPSRPAIWRSLWFWRALSAALAILAAVLILPKGAFRHDPALSASLQPATTPAPKVVQVAIMQAPGLSSTPGWVLTVDSRQNLVLAPQVDIVVPETESVYLWTYHEQSP